MKHTDHDYTVAVSWTGNHGTGTSAYSAYGREHEYEAPGKIASIPGTSAPSYRGDASRYNPEELLVGALASCHMLWYLHLCAEAGIVVTEYRDDAVGTVRAHSGGGEFTQAVLRPRIRLQDPSREEDARALHHQAHERCYIARSVNFPVRCEPQFDD